MIYQNKIQIRNRNGSRVTHIWVLYNSILPLRRAVRLESRQKSPSFSVFFGGLCPMIAY